MLEIDCDLYALPNMHQPYLHDIEERLEDAGADFDDSHIVYAGGTLYGHAAKQRHPDAEITVVEKEPLVAYLQTFAAYELDQERSQASILEDIFLIEDDETPARSTTRNFVAVSDARYQQIQERHRDFLESAYAPFDDRPDNLIGEPGVHRDEYLETAEEPDLTGEKELFKTGLDEDKEQLDEAFDILYSHVVEDGKYDEDELQAAIEGLDLDDTSAVKEEAAFYARNWIDRSHLRWAEENNIYAFVRETDDGKEITTKQSIGNANMYTDILDEIDGTAPVDRVLVDDVRDVDLDGDIIITNNVFDYIDPDEVGPTVDGLSGDNGAYMETSLINHGYEERGRRIDQSIAPRMELVEAAPDVDFWWSAYGSDRKEDCPTTEGIRLYRPAGSPTA